ncbi:MAG: ABC transporter ATP-binding protein [Candidatus Accumulibacter sp.]|jgi:manganese/iron transport system ATP-binding protein|nr:ABC transporter ATP-binding protein [Accumulibacter sp.]
MPEVLANLSRVDVAFGHRKILHGICLSIAVGEFWTLIGPNGAGKSTLLGLFNGMTPYGVGEVHFQGRKITSRNVARIRLAIAHVFQAIDLDPKMPLSVLESVLTGSYGRLGLFKKPGKREKDLAMRSLEVVGLAHLAARPIGHLSGGERQRVALARALTQEPEFLLLDEPTGFLDWHAQREILNTIADLRQQFNLTVLMVTHDLNAVFSLAQKVAMLKEGHLVWQGNVEKAMDPALLSSLYDVPITIVEYEGKKTALF